MCFDGGDDSASREMIQMQKDEATRAAKKEAERQARIKSGLLNIKYLFEGGKPTTKSVPGKFDWSKFAAPAGAAAASNKAVGTQVSGLPAGYKYAVIPGGGGTAAVATPAVSTPATRLGTLTGSPVQGISRGGGTGGSPNGGGNTSNSNPRLTTPAAPTAPGTWGIVGPDGKVYKIGDELGTTNTVVTGKTKGWQDEFLNEFRQKMLDYYQPQVLEQYGDAKNETTYRHARAGTLKSTGSIMNVADLAKQNKIRTGEVADNAATAVNELKTGIDNARDAAESQVYSTENPEVAAGAAQRAIKNITAEKPNLSPLGEIFEIATIGGANAVSGYQNAQRLRAATGQVPAWAASRELKSKGDKRHV